MFKNSTIFIIKSNNPIDKNKRIEIMHIAKYSSLLFMPKYNLCLVILINFIAISFYSCASFNKESLLPDQINNPPSESKGSYVFEEPAPCWVNSSPQKCLEYKNNKNLLIHCNINNIEKTKNEGTEIQNENIDKCFFSKFIQIKRKDFNVIIENNISECSNKIDVCHELLESFLTSEIVKNIKNNFEHKEKFWIDLENNLYEYHVLGLITYGQEMSLKKEFIKYIIDNVPGRYIPLNNPPVIWY